MTLAANIAVYQRIPLAQRTARQSAALATDLATQARQSASRAASVINPGIMSPALVAPTLNYYPAATPFFAAQTDAAFLGQAAAGYATPSLDPYPGASTKYGYTGVNTTSGVEGGIASFIASVFKNGVLIATEGFAQPPDTVALAGKYGITPGVINTVAGGPAGPLSTAYLAPAGGVSPVGPVNPGATLPGGGGIGSGGTLPGGSAGSTALTTGGVLAGLSHTTAGLNWSHLALWGAILVGGYLVLGNVAGGGRWRR